LLLLHTVAKQQAYMAGRERCSLLAHATRVDAVSLQGKLFSKSLQKTTFL